MSFRAARDLALAKATPKDGGAATSFASTPGHFTKHAHPTTTTPTTRLCVKGLPVHVKEDRLREIFSAKGEVTDVKLLKTSTGRSRQMAFVGYRSVEQATLAIKHFNKTFVDTSKIEVEYAVNPREAKEAMQPWSRHSEGSSRYADAHRDHSADASASSSSAAASSSKPAKSQDATSLALSKSAFSKSALFGLSGHGQLSKLLTDPKFQEYLHVMGSRSKNKFWSNTTMDDTHGPGHTAEEMAAVRGEQSFQTYEQYLAEMKADKRAKGGALDEDDEEDDEYFNQPMLDRDADADAEAQAETTKAKVKSTKKTKSKAAAGEEDAAMPDAVVLNEAVSDLDYLKSRQGAKDFDDDSDMEDSAPATTKPSATTGTKRKAAAAEEEEAEKEAAEGEDSELKAAYESDQRAAESASASRIAADDLMDTGRLFLRNLSYSVREGDLRDLFAPFGSIAEIHLPVDELQKPKGFAHVSFMFPAHALAAQRSLDGHFFLGRLLHILNGRPKPVVKTEWEKLQEMGDDAKNAVTYKKRKELETQALAGTKKDQASWNTLFIRSDTVTEAIAAKYGLAKNEILDTTNEAGGTGMAVRLALAESTLISETKAFLAEHGVDLAVFAQDKAKTVRSQTALIVKNIPFNTELDELRRLFAAHGTLGAVVMPPARTMAMVEFIEAADAKKAFKALAYKKFKYVPLYLEWAPEGAFVQGGAPAAAGAGSAGVIAGKKGAAAAEEEVETGDASTEASTLYVKNLNFATTDDGLRTLFSRVGPLRSCVVNMKKNTKQRPHTTDPAFLSMGYGFVEYRTAADANKALAQLQGVQLDNHALELKLSSRGTTATGATTTTSTKPRTAAAVAHVAAAAAEGVASAAGGAAPSSKLLVKNVPFETTARELRELFSAFGSIQRIRLPKKFGQLGHRGFAFIDFTSKAEAKNAMDNVRHSHLYGRHLVIEYAAPQVDQDSQDVDGLRKKTQEQYATLAGGAPPHKKRKVDADEDEIDQAFDKQFK